MTKNSDNEDWDFVWDRLANTILDGFNELEAISDSLEPGEVREWQYKMLRDHSKFVWENGYIWGVSDHMDHPMRAMLKGAQLQEGLNGPGD